MDLAKFLATPAGSYLRIVLSMMRPNNDTEPAPIPGVDYNQLCAADAMKKRGYELAVANLSHLSTLPAPPRQAIEQKYSKPEKKQPTERKKR